MSEKYVGSNVSRDPNPVPTGKNVVVSVRPPDFKSDDEWSGFKSQIERAFSQGLLPRSVDSKEKALVLALKGRELGLEPLYALSILHLINGKPGMEAQAMQALVYRKYPMAEICKVSPEEKRHEVCTLKARRSSQHEWQEVTFTIEDAIKMGLVGRDKNGQLFVVNNKRPWVESTPDMLFARAASRIVRRVWPECIMGCYTPEELQPQLANVASAALPTASDIDARFAEPKVSTALPPAQEMASIIERNMAKPEPETAPVLAPHPSVAVPPPGTIFTAPAVFADTGKSFPPTVVGYHEGRAVCVETPPAMSEGRHGIVPDNLFEKHEAVHKGIEALPDSTITVPLPASTVAALEAALPGDYRITFGRYSGKQLFEIPEPVLRPYLADLKRAQANGTAIPAELVTAIEAFLKAGI